MKFPDDKLGKESLLTFGKYKGNKIGYILETDPGYIVWCVETLEWFSEKLNTEIYEEALEMLSYDQGTNIWFEDPYEAGWFMEEEY